MVDDRPRAGLHPVLRDRRSPAAFDAELRVTDVQLEVLLEAARWAPSAGNSQPWSFVVGRRGDETYSRIVRHLAASSTRWAAGAAVLVVNVCHRSVEGTDWAYSDFSFYDLGQAVAHMTIQASAMGLAARQFRAFHKDALTSELKVPEHLEITTITAIGAAAPASDSAGRQRRPVSDLTLPAAPRERIGAVRIARQTANLEKTVAFYRDGLGLPLIDAFAGHAGYDGVMIGLPGTNTHLEFTATTHGVPPVPHVEDLIVLYLGDRETVDEILAAAGAPVVASANPYWDEVGVTIEDPDGFRVVVVAGSWSQ